MHVKTLPLLLFSTLIAPVAAQGEQAEWTERRAKKLASPFLKANQWFTDFDKACAEAKKTKKVVFGYFTRSYSP
jgi:hypothetical protein